MLNSTPSISPPADWSELRRLYYNENYQRKKDIQEVQRLRNQNLALKLATRKYYLLDDALAHLCQLYKSEARSEFAAIYTARYVQLEKTTMEKAISSSRHPSFLDSISSQSTQNILKFVAKLRDQPQLIVTIILSLTNEELENLDKAEKGSVKPTVIDLLIFVLYGSSEFLKEETLRRRLWTTVFVSLIKEKKGEKFMLDVLDKYVRLTEWNSKGILETQLMRILRRSEGLLASENDEECHSVFGRSSGPTTRSVDMENFLDKSCIDLLNIIDQYIPACILTLSRGILEELPEQYHHSATLFLVVKFFFYRFLARVITYPEYYGMLDDYYFTEKQRQRILFPLHQKLYAYATRFTTPSSGWSRSSETDNKIRHLVERIVSHFSPPQLVHHQDQSLADPTTEFTPLPRLCHTVETVHPPTDVFPNITSTVVLCPSDVVSLVEFVTKHKRYAISVANTKKTYSREKTSDDSFENIVMQMRKATEELKHVSNDTWVLIYANHATDQMSLNDPALEVDETPDFPTMILPPSSLFPYAADQQKTDTPPEIPESVRIISSAVLQVISHYDIKLTPPGTGGHRNSSPLDISILQLLDAGIRAARFSCNISEATNYQHARNLVETLPEFYRKENNVGLIRCMMQPFEQRETFRANRRRIREDWGNYIHEWENRLRSALTRKEYRFSCLRLRMFYLTFRNTRQFERSRNLLAEIATKGTPDESEQIEVKKYLQDKGIHNFMLGEVRFHRFCMEIDALKTSAMVALWCSDLYSKEAAVHSHQTRKAHSGSGLGRSGSLSFYTASKSFARRTAHADHHRKKSASSRSSGDPYLLEQELKGHYCANGASYQHLTGGDFALIMQMKLLGFLLSDFNHLYKYAETDSWFNEFLQESSSEEYDTDNDSHYAASLPEISPRYQEEDPHRSCSLNQELYLPSSPKSVSTVSSATTTSGLSITSPVSTFTPLGESLSSILSDSFSQKSTNKNASRAGCNDTLAYNTLCTHLTLHPSPFQKLHTLYALELFIVAHLTSENAPGTDSIVNEIELVFRSVRPRGLIRDMQIIATFIPSIILDLSDEGKVFWDMSLAVTSLQKEVIDRIVTKGTKWVEHAGEWRKNPRRVDPHQPSSESKLGIDYQLEEQEEALHQMEAVRLFTIAAKENHPVAQRELAILYMSLPGIPFVGRSSNLTTTHPRGYRAPTPPSPSTPTTPTFFSFMYDTNVKYNEANIASAMYWFSKAANQGDDFSQRYLQHRDGAGMMGLPQPFPGKSTKKLYSFSNFTSSRSSMPPPLPSSLPCPPPPPPPPPLLRSPSMRKLSFFSTSG